MDGGSADYAGAVICRPPWMAGVQITQERLSAAPRAAGAVDLTDLDQSPAGRAPAASVGTLISADKDASLPVLNGAYIH